MLKLTLILSFVLIAMVVAKPGCPGCLTEAKGNKLRDIEKELNLSLTKLASGDDGPSYKLGKINSASSQVVSGMKYFINADLIDENEKTKTCDIEIWSQRWLPNGIQVTFKCPDEDNLIRKHSA